MKKILLNILLTVCVCVFLLSAGMLIHYWHETSVSSRANREVIENVVQTVPSAAPETVPENAEGDFPEYTIPDAPREPTAPIRVDFAPLQEEYPDVRAWLYCPGTPIHYPVAQGKDNEQYLHRMLNGDWNANGTLFLDYRNLPDFSDRNTVIYGHHMQSGAMFGTICEYKNQSYYEEHPSLYLLTPEQDYEVKLVAGYLTGDDSVAYHIPMGPEEREEFLQILSERSTFESSTEVKPDDLLVSLSTCSYEYENARFVVVGVLRKLGKTG